MLLQVRIIPLLLFALASSSCIAQYAQMGSKLPAVEVTMSEAIPLNLEQIRQEVGYPTKAIRSGLQGVVVCRIKISETGQYVDHEVLRQAHPTLTSLVERHIPGLRFEPARIEGRAVISWIKIPFTFALSDEESTLPEESDWADYLEWGKAYHEEENFDMAERYFDKGIILSRQVMTANEDIFKLFLARSRNNFSQRDWEGAHGDLATLIAFALEPGSSLAHHLPELYLERAFASLMQNNAEQAFKDFLWLGINHPLYRPLPETYVFTIPLTADEQSMMVHDLSRLATYKGAPQLITYLYQVYEIQLVNLAVSNP